MTRAHWQELREFIRDRARFWWDIDTKAAVKNRGKGREDALRAACELNDVVREMARVGQRIARRQRRARRPKGQ